MVPMSWLSIALTSDRCTCLSVTDLVELDGFCFIFFPPPDLPGSHLNGVVFSYPMECPDKVYPVVSTVCVYHDPSLLFFSPFSLLLKGLMGPEGKDGPPGLQGLQ